MLDHRSQEFAQINHPMGSGGVAPLRGELARQRYLENRKTMLDHEFRARVKKNGGRRAVLSVAVICLAVAVIPIASLI